MAFITRYDVPGGGDVEECSNGYYVRHADHLVYLNEMRLDFDAQRLRADTAEAERDGTKAANNVLREELRTERLRADAAAGDANEAEAESLRKDSVIEDLMQSNGDMTTCLAAAEQRIAELLELLRLMTVEYACCLEAGHDRITFLGGDCDSVSKMLADNVNYAKACAALNPEPEEGSHADDL